MGIDASQALDDISDLALLSTCRGHGCGHGCGRANAAGFRVDITEA